MPYKIRSVSNDPYKNVPVSNVPDLKKKIAINFTSFGWALKFHKKHWHGERNEMRNQFTIELLQAWHMFTDVNVSRENCFIEIFVFVCYTPRIHKY